MKHLLSILAILAGLSSFSEVLVYKAVFHMKIPRVYDNMESQGYRKLQTQVVNGIVYVDKGNLDENGEPAIEMYLTNKTHKVAGKKVTYLCETLPEETMLRYIGSNKTGVFKKPCLKFKVNCDPSYNVGDDEPDNALIFTFSGVGNSENKITGAIAGQIGCGCYAYGHVSPTRTVEGKVDDRVPMYGKGYLKLIRRK